MDDYEYEGRNPAYSDDRRSLFFSDNKEVARSYTRAFDEDSCGNFLESRRENILNLSKSLLNSIKKGFTRRFFKQLPNHRGKTR